jgi:hypothetical protein
MGMRRMFIKNKVKKEEKRDWFSLSIPLLGSQKNHLQKVDIFTYHNGAKDEPCLIFPN